VNRILATLLTIAALAVGLTSKAALVILGALATAFGFVMYVLLVGVIWGFRFPTIGAVLGVLAGMIAVFLTYKIWPKPAVHALRLLGHLHRSGGGLHLPRAGFQGHEETIKRQAEVREMAGQRRRAQRVRQEVAQGHEDRRAGVVLLRHRAGLYPGQQRLFLLPAFPPCGPGRSSGGSSASS
jgi:hypothetical protein